MTLHSGEHSKEPRNDGVPIEALWDAIARIDANGGLHPCNGRMRDLLGELSADADAPITQLEQLPLDGSDDDSNEGEIVLSLGRSHSCRIVEHNGSRWLIATELQGPSGGVATELAAKRLRVLGGLAGSIVHDLANLLLAGVGVAETLKPYISNEVDAQTLDELKAGARQGTALGRALASQLNSSPRDWESVSVQRLVDDVVAIVGKNAAGRGIAVTVANEVSGTVHVLYDEAVQALMHGLLFCLGGGAQRISVSGQLEKTSIAAGRERLVARIRIAASPVAEATMRLAREVLTGDQGLLDALSRAPLDASGLAHARLAVTRVGGEVTVASGTDSIGANSIGGDSIGADSMVLDYCWPTARADKPVTRPR